ncbi:metalloregulator ArsR/SmtB family transcription factor [Aerococcus sp. UMB8487]|nr:metalloregulator ArsR/SmtB family transcription factor [Aerococcus sp. UMB8487]
MKAMSDPNRLKILDLISCDGKRACEILYFFNFTQPTLSHHMKSLCEANLVEKSRDGKWVFYTLNRKTIGQINEQISKLLADDESDCLCHLMTNYDEIDERK